MNTKKYWILEEKRNVETTTLEYYFYKMKQLKDNRNNLNKNFYNETFMLYMEAIAKEMLTDE